MHVDKNSAEIENAPDKQNAAAESYNSWVLRMWQEESQDTWRASLKDARDGKQTNFSSIASLVEFLKSRGVEG